MLIIGILASVALPQYTNAVEKARLSEAISLAKNYSDASQRYFLENNEWPTDFETLDIDLPNGYTVSDNFAKSSKFEIWLDGSGELPAIRIYKIKDGAKTDYFIFWTMGDNRKTCNIHAGIINPLNARGRKLCQSLGGVPSSIEGIWSF